MRAKNVKCEVRGRQESKVAQLVYPPLTPALSPLRGEGARTALHDPLTIFAARVHTGAWFHNESNAEQNDLHLNALVATPSPLNGERAGVRGGNVSRFTISPITSIPTRLVCSNFRAILLLALLPLLFVAHLGAAPAPRDSSLNLRLTAPIKTWDEAIPLGNGTMGGLLWGETNLLRLSLDRGDLWDERPSKRFTEVRDKFNWRTMQQLVASNRMAEFHDIYDSNYDYNGPPTKLPAGRVEIMLDPSQTVEAFELNLATARTRPRRGRGR